jgi:hypothetical protein
VRLQSRACMARSWSCFRSKAGAMTEGGCTCETSKPLEILSTLLLRRASTAEHVRLRFQTQQKQTARRQKGCSNQYPLTTMRFNGPHASYDSVPKNAFIASIAATQWVNHRHGLNSTLRHNLRSSVPLCSSFSPCKLAIAASRLTPTYCQHPNSCKASRLEKTSQPSHFYRLSNHKIKITSSRHQWWRGCSHLSSA